MIPPASVEDDTTNKGAVKVILLFLAMFGILEAMSQEGTNGDVKGLKLADDYKDQHLMIIGDGLSQNFARTFNELIEDTSYSLGPQHSARVMIQKALNQIIHVTGDLNGG